MKNKNFFKNKKILVTGGAGFLGCKVVAGLIKTGTGEKNIFVPRSRAYNLRIRSDCDKVTKNKDLVIHCAATVGGIEFNKNHPAKIFDDNLSMGFNLISSSYANDVGKFVMIGTICEYPKYAKIPFKESELWDGYPEESNGAYGVSKKAILAQGQAYRQEYGFDCIHLLLANLYGPGDHFDPKHGHVIPALIHKIDQAKKNKNDLVVWGTGKPTRSFIYVEDAAEAIILATEKYSDIEPINIASQEEISIKDLTILLCDLMNYKGKIIWDTNKPDGQMRRAIDTSQAKNRFNFRAKTNFEEGIRKTIDWYLAHYNQINIKKPR